MKNLVNTSHEVRATVLRGFYKLIVFATKMQEHVASLFLPVDCIVPFYLSRLRDSVEWELCMHVHSDKLCPFTKMKIFINMAVFLVCKAVRAKYDRCMSTEYRKFRRHGLLNM